MSSNSSSIEKLQFTFFDIQDKEEESNYLFVFMEIFMTYILTMNMLVSVKETSLIVDGGIKN